MPGAVLSVYERVKIHSFLVAEPDRSWASMGRELVRPPSTISREIGRNGGRTGYCPVTAQQRADVSLTRPKPRRSDDSILKEFASPRLLDGVSPWAVAFAAKQAGISVCAATLYRIVYTQGWTGVTSTVCLRSRRARPRRRSRIPVGGAIAADAPSIRNRPAGASDRSEGGHVEGDLIIGKGNKSAMITLVDRLSGHGSTIVLGHGYTTEIVVRELSEWISGLDASRVKSLTWDRGSEMAGWEFLTQNWGVPVYFCDPHSPWQRPVNENFNRQLRYWFPKGTCLKTVTQKQADRACHILNNQPRRARHGATAQHVYDQSCTDQ